MTRSCVAHIYYGSVWVSLFRGSFHTASWLWKIKYATPNLYAGFALSALNECINIHSLYSGLLGFLFLLFCWLELEAFQLSELRISSDTLHSCTRDDRNRETEEKKKRKGRRKTVTDFLKKLKRIVKKQWFFDSSRLEAEWSTT